MCLIGLVDPGMCPRIEVHAHRSFVIGTDRHALQTQFPPSRIELWNSSQFRFPSSHSVCTIAAATNPIAKPIKGLSTANQKETFHSGFSGFGFLFMLLFSSVQRWTFHKTERFSANALGAVHNCCAIDTRLRQRLCCSLSEKQAR